MDAKLNRNIVYVILSLFYRKEVLATAVDATYAGMWQIHAMASVLRCDIISIYPEFGGATVRKELNRRILPREKKFGKDKGP